MPPPTATAPSDGVAAAVLTRVLQLKQAAAPTVEMVHGWRVEVKVRGKGAWANGKATADWYVHRPSNDGSEPKPKDALRSMPALADALELSDDEVEATRQAVYIVAAGSAPGQKWTFIDRSDGESIRSLAGVKRKVGQI